MTDAVCDEGHGMVIVDGERVCPICDDVTLYMEDNNE